MQIHKLFRSKSLEALRAQAENPEHQLKKNLGTFDLTMFGIGAIIGAGIFSSIGTVREGKSLAESLTQTGVFPDLASEMITVGEQTGALPQMLNSVAEFFEEDVATALTAALALIEPAILIVMGVVVVFILISLYLPIFSLGQAGGAAGG